MVKPRQLSSAGISPTVISAVDGSALNLNVQCKSGKPPLVGAYDSEHCGDLKLVQCSLDRLAFNVGLIVANQTCARWARQHFRELAALTWIDKGAATVIKKFLSE